MLKPNPYDARYGSGAPTVSESVDYTLDVCDDRGSTFGFYLYFVWVTGLLKPNSYTRYMEYNLYVLQ